MDLVIRASKIHQYGCYTKGPIKRKTRIIEYIGPRITVKQADALYDGKPETYLFGLSSSKLVIDGNGIAAFINHSCDPNCEIDEIRGRIYIFALRDIKAGEELTYDYNLYDGDDDAPCHCGAKNCRGTLYTLEELAKKKRRAARKKTNLKKKSVRK